MFKIFKNVKDKIQIGRIWVVALCLVFLCGCQAEVSEQDSASHGTSPDAVNTEVLEETDSKGPEEEGGNGLDRGNMEEPAYTAVNLTKDIEGDAGAKAAVDDDFLSGTTRFSMHLLKQCIADEKEKKNYMISPVSVQLALAMAANGADGDTKDELLRVLSGDIYDTGEIVKCTSGSLDMEALNQYLAAYTGQLTESEKIDFNIANAIWMRDDEEKLKVEADYLKKLVSFQAEAFRAPFDATTVKDINEWVNYQTEGMIPDIIQEIPDEAVIYLLNALTFQGRWLVPFDEYSIDTDFVFTSADGVEQNAEGMRQELYGYLSGENAEGFLKYYENDRFAFAAILPKEGMTAEEYVLDLSSEAFTSLFENVSMEMVNIEMPKFQSEYEIEMSQVLKVLGIEEAFKDEADFYNMAKTDTGILKLDQVLHKTFIEVDENGTKAAAVTMVSAVKQTALIEEPKKVVLDRPFVYAIMDMDTKLPIFIGILNSVE